MVLCCMSHAEENGMRMEASDMNSYILTSGVGGWGEPRGV